MQGIFIGGRRPKSKKEVREALAEGKSVRLEATSLFGNEFDGQVRDAPDGKYLFVGPDPYTKRSFYGSLVVKAGLVVVK